MDRALDRGLAPVLLAGLAPGAVFALHLLLSRGTGAYRAWPHLDVPMHLAGGAAIAHGCRALVAHAWGRLPERLLEEVLLVSLTALAALLWELAEFTTDALGWTRAQAGLADTMLDLAMGLCGGTVYAALSWARRARAVKVPA